MTRALAILLALARVARADAPTPPPPSDADPRAEEAASEANLKSNAPRAGIVVSTALGGGLVLGDGVGRGPALSLRVGHVATRQTVLTFELSGTSLLHEPPMDHLRHNDMGAVMAGALVYVAPSVWVRGAGGFIAYTVDDPGASKTPHPGVGGVAGAGLDIFRWRYLALGIELFGIGGVVATKGLMVGTGLCVGLSYY